MSANLPSSRLGDIHAHAHATVETMTTTGLDFILGHLSPPNELWPRTISTRKTAGRQIMAYNKSECLAHFRESNFVDCRLNAYQNENLIPNLLFIDIDKSDFKSNVGLSRALNATLSQINTRLNAKPTVLSTGGGFHILQPIRAIPLEQISDFNDFHNPSNNFLRFVARYLSNNKSDSNNNPSINSCMLRVPGSINSKYPSNNIVKVIQYWDDTKPDFRLLLGSFYANITNQKMNDMKNPKIPTNTNYSSINWIENLLKMPIADFRKNTVSLILAPYLVNDKHLGYNSAYEKIILWLSKCNNLRKLDYGFNHRVKAALKYAINNNYKPLTLTNLQLRNPEIYRLVI